MKRFLLVAPLLLLAACGPDTGADSPQAAVDAYVAALNAEDADAVQRLGNPSPASSDDDGQRKVDELGGRDIRLDSTDITTPISPYHAIAKLRGSSSAGAYSEDLYLERDTDDRWHIGINKPMVPDPHKPTAAITPPTSS